MRGRNDTMQASPTLLPASAAVLSNTDELAAFLAESAQALGFEYFAYGRRPALPVSTPRVAILSSYPGAWQKRYEQAQYAQCDPSIAASRKSMLALAWSDRLFADTPQLWSEARNFGLKVGCAQFICDAHGNSGMLTLARGHEALTEKELQAKAMQIHWLAVLAHECYARITRDLRQACAMPPLTERETEVLRWTADGKTAAEIALILRVSASTVNFHLKNAMQKLSVPNKAAAVLQAAMGGLLD